MDSMEVMASSLREVGFVAPLAAFTPWPALVGDAGVGGRWLHDEGRAGLVRTADREPAHPAVADVVADLEAESMVMSMAFTLVAARTPVLLDS